MSVSLVERARELHAENERHTLAVIEDLAGKRVRSLKEDVLQSHRVKRHLDAIVSNAQELRRYYDDEDGLRRAEIDAMGGVPGQENSIFTQFYEKLKEIRDFYKNSQIPVTPIGPDESKQSSEDLVAVAGQDLVEFSGEEFFGKYLDMQNLYEKFLNVKAFRKIKFLNYLKNFADFAGVDAAKKDGKYVEYLKELLEYLVSFHQKVYPLYPISMLIEKVEFEFKVRKEHAMKGKNEWFCSACNKIFAKESVYNGHLSGKKHLKNVENSGSGDSIELLEFKIRCFAKFLKERSLATIQYVESLQTKTYEEIEFERMQQYEEEAEEEEEDEAEGEEGVIYNPLKIPLGWDGKPIPYWLYKLHGLNLEFKCEICGDFSYWGPRAYERHFSEWRHVNGMKALGIPNTKHFKWVTKIQDAIQLYHRIMELDKQRIWRVDVDEEFEDEEGNVFNRKTFEDLKRQGIL